MTDEQSTYMSFEDSMDISNADDLYKKLCQLFDNNRNIVLDADKVERIDTSAFQVLCTFFKEADQRGMKVDWQNPSEPLIRSARLLGVHEFLNLA